MFRRQIPVHEVDQRLFRWASDIIGQVAPKMTVHNPHGVTFDPAQRYIIMANHTSLFDIPLTFLALKGASIRMLAKKELYAIPIFGTAMKKALFPFINRKDRNQAIEDLEQAKTLMENHRIALWIAPEGKRSANGELQPFKKGAFITAIQAQATLLPLAIQGAFDILPYKAKHITTGQEVIITLGPPLDCRGYTPQNKEQLREQAFNIMQELLNH